jgi:hypothetical protein
MTKKHFKQLAEMINSLQSQAKGSEKATSILEQVTRELANFCANENCRFDKSRFYSACGYPQ